MAIGRSERHLYFNSLSPQEKYQVLQNEAAANYLIDDIIEGLEHYTDSQNIPEHKRVIISTHKALLDEMRNSIISRRLSSLQKQIEGIEDFSELDTEGKLLFMQDPDKANVEIDKDVDKMFWYCRNGNVSEYAQAEYLLLGVRMETERDKFIQRRINNLQKEQDSE